MRMTLRRRVPVNKVFVELPMNRDEAKRVRLDVMRSARRDGTTMCCSVGKSGIHVDCV